MAARVKRPAVLRSPWPPTDAMQSQQVTLLDDWSSLQTLFSRGDIWDIIYYNFETYNPDEVNWYLYEWLGCRQLSGSGFNYRFGRESGNTEPITVYIPEDDYLPPGRRQAEAQRFCVSVLHEPAAWRMSFKIGAFELREGDLLAVADAIDFGKITVIHRPSNGHMAYYNPGLNRIEVPFHQSSGFHDNALIVHEAMHAAMDIRRVPLTMAQSEGLGYIAQALYLQAHGIDLGNAVINPSFLQNPRNFIAWTGIFGRASAIAKSIGANESVSTLDFDLLSISLFTSETYHDATPPVNDGI
jgi:hypothetical protein